LQDIFTLLRFSTGEYAIDVIDLYTFLCCQVSRLPSTLDTSVTPCATCHFHWLLSAYHTIIYSSYKFKLIGKWYLLTSWNVTNDQLMPQGYFKTSSAGGVLEEIKYIGRQSLRNIKEFRKQEV
jgi:hypothetical protein